MGYRGWVAWTLAVAFLSGCAGTQQENQEKAVQELYNKAMTLIEKNEYMSSAEAFEEVERQHPYSYWANKAQLMAAYAFYKARAYERAIETLDVFIQLHPGHPDAAYAHYLKAFCYYHQISVVERDQKMTELALEALTEVVRRFPNSSYAKDAQLKLQLTKDHLAGRDMLVGRFYQKNHIYAGALGRFRHVLEHYQGTTHIPEALYRLVECHLAVGIFAEAKRMASILGHNYPSSTWYTQAYNLMLKVNPEQLKQEVTRSQKESQDSIPMFNQRMNKPLELGAESVDAPPAANLPPATPSSE